MINTRPFQPADTRDLVDLWYDVTVHDQSFIPRSFWDGARGLIENQYLPIARTWVSVDEQGSLTGFVSLIDDLMGGLFVKRGCQSRGIGGELVALAARKQSPLFVEVFEKNTRARAFYRGCGFKETERHVQEETGEMVIKKQLINPR